MLRNNLQYIDVKTCPSPPIDRLSAVSKRKPSAEYYERSFEDSEDAFEAALYVNRRRQDYGFDQR